MGLPSGNVWKANDVNFHIYTWNALLLGNLLTASNFQVCDCFQEYTAWVHIKIEKYKENPHQFCVDSLHKGKNVENRMSVYCIAAKSAKTCTSMKEKMKILK